MRLAILWIILRKELLETLRDRKTIFRVLGLPVLIYPLLVIGTTKFVDASLDARDARASRVAVWGDAPADFSEALAHADKITATPWAGAPEDVKRDLVSGAAVPPDVPDEDAPDPDRRERKRSRWVEPESPTLAAARSVVSRRDTDAVLVLWPGFRAAVEGDGEGAAFVYYDSVRPDSAKARDRVERAVRDYRKQILAQRTGARGLGPGFAAVAHITARNVAPEGRLIGQILGGLMPFLLVGMSLLGALYPAIDLTAGEKERGTMQTLLCAPLRPIEIILGKFLAVWSLSLLMALVNLASLGATLARTFSAFGLGATAPPSVYALTFLMLLPVTFLVSAIFLALAAFARDFKDGQNVLIPVYIPLYLLAGVTVMPGIELDVYTAFVPVVNISLLIKAAFLGEAKPDLVFLALGSSALYAALALVLAARVFGREDVLLGGGTLRDVLRIEKRAEPTPAYAFTAVSLVLVAGFYGSLALGRFGKLPMLLTVEYGLMLLPTLGAVALGGLALRPTLALRAPPLRSLLAALLLGPSAGIVVLALVRYVAPIPEEFAKALGDALQLDGEPLWVLLFVVGVTPAICEELLFRGLVFAGFRRLGPAAAVGLSALLFAFAHASIYRLLPTFTLGVVLGYARHRSGSIVPGMVIHALNNGLAITLLVTQPAWAARFLDEGRPSVGLTLAALALCGGAVALLRSIRSAAGEAATGAGGAT